MLRLGLERSELDVVDDQFGAPTAAAMLAEKTVHSLAGLDAGDPGRSLTGVAGTYNLTCSGKTSWCGFAREIFRRARELGWPLQVREVRGIPTSSYPTPAPRPLNCLLDCRRYCERFATTLPSWQQCLDETLRQIPIP